MKIFYGKTVLMTGATGYLGSQLAIKLVKEGCRVIVLKRNNSILLRLAEIQSLLVLYDIDELINLERPFNEFGPIDCVIHLATSYGRSGELQSQISESNTMFPIRLLEKAIFFNTPTFINIDTTLPPHLNSYTLSKRYFADWGRLSSEGNSIRFINVPLHVMYGALDDSSKFTTHIIESCLNNVPEIKLTGGEQLRDFIYISDVVDGLAILLSCSNELSSGFHEFQLGSGVSITLRQYVETVHKLTSSKTVLLFGALPYRPREPRAIFADTSSLRALGWHCRISLEEGIIHSINMLLKNHPRLGHYSNEK